MISCLPPCLQCFWTLGDLQPVAILLLNVVVLAQTAIMMGVGYQARISKNILVFWPVSHTATVVVCISPPPPPAAACLQRKKTMVGLSSPVKLELGILHTIMWHALALAESVFQLGIYLSEHGHQAKELPTCLNNVNPSLWSTTLQLGLYLFLNACSRLLYLYITVQQCTMNFVFWFTITHDQHKGFDPGESNPQDDLQVLASSLGPVL
jgi:hypothetical protein